MSFLMRGFRINGYLETEDGLKKTPLLGIVQEEVGFAEASAKCLLRCLFIPTNPEPFAASKWKSVNDTGRFYDDAPIVVLDSLPCSYADAELLAFLTPYYPFETEGVPNTTESFWLANAETDKELLGNVHENPELLKGN